MPEIKRPAKVTESISLSILTKPVSESFNEAGRIWLRSFVHAARGIVKGRSLSGFYGRYGGHHSVTRSLVEGLKKIGIAFNYDPSLSKYLMETVIVLSGIDALEQAIQLKRAGRIKRLLAGPNLVVLPSDHREQITAKEIDVYLVNSEWTHAMYLQDAPELASRCSIWPAGVDTNYWIPTKEHKDKILIYQKTEQMEIIEQCECWLNESGYEVSRIIYGSYSEGQYLSHLRSSACAIFFSKHESQGLALAEAWSVDVPTFVWDPGYALTNPGTNREKRWKASSAPYLTPATGARFVDSVTFKRAISEWNKSESQFTPRAWVLQNMSDEVSARKLLKIAMPSI